MSVFHLLYLSFGCTYYIISVSVIQCYLMNDRYYTGQDNGKSIAGFPGVIVISGVLAIYELLPAFHLLRALPTMKLKLNMIR